MSHAHVAQQEALRAPSLVAGSLGKERCIPRSLPSMVDRTRGGCWCALARPWLFVVAGTPLLGCDKPQVPGKRLQSCCRLEACSSISYLPFARFFIRARDTHFTSLTY